MKRKRSKSKNVSRASCSTSSKTYVMIKKFRVQPADNVCMALAKKFAVTERNLHQKKYCSLKSCSAPKGKCTAMAYYCYKLTKQATGYKLTVTVKCFCKCISIPIPSQLVVYDCKKV